MGIISITLDLASSRWYMYYSHTDDLSEAVAFSDATFSLLEPSSQPSSQPSVAPTVVSLSTTVLHIEQLTETRSSVVDVGVRTGAFGGSIALSSTKLFVSDMSGSVNIDSATLNIDSVMSSEVTYFALVGDLSTRQVYSLLDGDGLPLTESGFLEGLQRVESTADMHTNSRPIVWLSESVALSFGSAVFAGSNRIVVADRSSLLCYSIFPSTGKVTYLGSVLPRWQHGDNWLSWGVAEFSSVSGVSLVYGSLNGTIERQVVGSDNTLESVFSSALGDVTSLSMDTTQQVVLLQQRRRSLWQFLERDTGLRGCSD
jgi:hypothetical protein